MAITSIWWIKGRVDNMIRYACNPEKTVDMAFAEAMHTIDNVVRYAADELKTEQTMYVTGINCNPAHAPEQFMQTKERWGKLGGRTCYHGIQSFKPGEVTASQAHDLGVALAKELWGNRFEVVVATHCNTDCYHNHFVMNSVSVKDGKKFYCMLEDEQRMRTVSDRLCHEACLSVIQEPKGRKKHYAEWKAEQEGAAISHGDEGYGLRVQALRQKRSASEAALPTPLRPRAVCSLQWTGRRLHSGRHRKAHPWQLYSIGTHSEAIQKYRKHSIFRPWLLW